MEAYILISWQRYEFTLEFLSKRKKKVSAHVIVSSNVREGMWKDTDDADEIKRERERERETENERERQRQRKKNKTEWEDVA